MLELRWVLLALGLLVILGVYLWGRGVFSGNSLNLRRAQERREPRLNADEDDEVGPEGESLTDDRDVPVEHVAHKARPHRAAARMLEKVVTIRLVPREPELTGDTAVLAMRRCGLEHGEYGIFHRPPADDVSTPVFSVSNLTEPGSFDLTRLSEMKLPGLSIFMILPGEGDPVARFDDMLETARVLARELDGELFDDKGSSWSIQRERYIREEMIQYKHQMQHG